MEVAIQLIALVMCPVMLIVLARAMGRVIFITRRVPAKQVMVMSLALATLLHTLRLVIAIPRNMLQMFGYFIKKMINYMYLVEDRKNVT